MSQRSIDEPALLRPGWLLIGNSLVFAAACVFAGGYSFAWLWHWNPLNWVGGLLMTPLALSCARWQYLATFRGDGQAAARLAGLLALCGGLLLIPMGVTIARELPEAKIPAIEIVRILGVPIAIGAWFLFTAVLLIVWRNRIERSFAVASYPSAKGPPPIPANWRITPSRLNFATALSAILAVAAVSPIAAVGTARGIHDIPPREAMHVSPAAAQLSLPAGASDVCVSRGARGVIGYDFAIDESDFRRWAHEAINSPESETDFPLTKIDAPLAIWCCHGDDGETWGSHTIDRGWYYSHGNSGHGPHYAYDADNGRAYFGPRF